jgi:putative transcriptional regulator
MKKNKRYRSAASAAIHGMMEDMHDAGVIDKQTMRKFDDSCLTPIVTFTAAKIKALRKREGVSQKVLALHLNMSKDSISQWERGEKHPAGASAKLLSLIDSKGLSSIA